MKETCCSFGANLNFAIYISLGAQLVMPKILFRFIVSVFREFYYLLVWRFEPREFTA